MRLEGGEGGRGGADGTRRLELLRISLREPLDFYLSFYRWTVAWRQAANASHWGASMLEAHAPPPPLTLEAHCSLP